MTNTKKIEWILRIAVAGEFLGHGIFALQGKEQWIGWIGKLAGVEAGLATQLLFFVGIGDVLIAIFVLLRPMRPILLWAAFWGFWTALVRPIVGEPIWDFVERWANWGAPLALWFLLRKEKK
ncbi:hypothetical protein A3A21_02125 [Candidatus Jorgensenbacteria bacterium RIFCSPLOWO2_01_FULL_45_25b]|uniref:DoxX family protein n=1 Tax=Candidatus Jorgensenbacteria bacterium RIFCSPLOWO2_01_FULL_45_25b TaxID=1798471 RepID=A0A1F6BZA7_9BACT|nr:MAG: hypothetical protein A3A21_02125 [Candidatus Jorgensenbacteria bacterium RIFCSPLOWO2_01_FULL_45_25b]